MVPVTIDNAEEVAAAVKAGKLPGPAKSLAEALARIYADGGSYVQKTGKMEAGPARYRYAKEGDFIAALRPLMETHGVTVRPVGMEVITNELFQRKSGSDAYRVVVRVTYEFLHTSGDKATVQAFGEGNDSGDKAFNKAMTGALKYALRQTFCVETGDDPDDTPSHQQERAAKPTARQWYDARIDKIAGRADITPIYRDYEIDRANGTLDADAAMHVDRRLREAAAKYPKPDPAAAPAK